MSFSFEFHGSCGAISFSDMYNLKHILGELCNTQIVVKKREREKVSCGCQHHLNPVTLVSKSVTTASQPKCTILRSVRSRIGSGCCSVVCFVLVCVLFFCFFPRRRLDVQNDAVIVCCTPLSSLVVICSVHLHVMPLFAGEHLCPLATRVALHKAAPVEFAIALPHLGVLVCVVPSPTAHHVAPIRIGRGTVAESSLGTDAPRGSIFLTVVG